MIRQHCGYLLTLHHAGGPMTAEELLRSFLGGGVDLPLARQEITAATIETFAEPLIHIEIG
jgi:hypothetical protein